MPIRPQCSKVVLSYYQESDLAASPAAQYGTQVPDTYINKLFEPTEPVILGVTQTRIDDAEIIKGHEFPQDTTLDIVVAQDITIPFSFPMSCSIAGILYALAMGGYSVAGGPNYIHSMTALNACTTDQLPSTSWVLGLTGDVASYFLVKGVVINELKLVLDSPGRLTISGTAFSDGTLTAKPTFSIPTSSSADYWPLASSGTFTIDSVSNTSIFRSFEFTINNNLDLADGRSNVISAGIYLEELRLGNRSYTLTVKVDGHQGSALWNAFINGTSMELDLTVVYDVNNKVTFNFPVVKIDTCVQSFDGIRDVLDITFKVFYDSVDGTPVTVEVYNAIAEYLTLHGTLAAGVSPSASSSPSLSPSASASA